MTDIEHGTYAGAQAHRLRGEKPCEPCRDAQNAYTREWRKRTAYRDSRRGAYARNRVLSAIREMAPDLYGRLYRDACLEWDEAHPEETS